MNLGFVGLGAMGQVIVPRLLAAGHKVTGWNRTPARAKPLLEQGMQWADSPADVARASEITFSIVTDGAALKAVALGANGVLEGMQPGGVFIDMGTMPPDVTRSISATFAEHGFPMLDAPLSGSPVTVREGNASLMIGGDEAVYARVLPVLRAIGPKATYIGASGQAAVMKLAVNLLLMVEVIAFGEAIAIAEKGGVARDIALDAVLKSVTAAPVLGYRGPFILEGKMPAEPLADVTLQQKDMLLVLEMARKLGSPVPLAAAANEMMNACRGLGIDGNDFVVAHRVYRKLGGQD
jgi:3-hydroxyisobutyrate dehydrogenase-like beta-hydroxyacid dehydrogenase